MITKDTILAAAAAAADPVLCPVCGQAIRGDEPLRKTDTGPAHRDCR